MAFFLADFLSAKRDAVIAEWVKRLKTEVGHQYARRPRQELIGTVSEAYDANRRVLLDDDFGDIDRFIEKIAGMRLETGFLLSDIQMAFELFRTIITPLLAAETGVAEFLDVTTKINRCLTYSLHRFSDLFQSMHQARIIEHNEQLKAEVQARTADLKESEQKYKILVEEINDGYFVVQNERVVFANPAFCHMHGYKTVEVNGKCFYDFIDPLDRDEVIRIYDQGLKNRGVGRTFEYRRLTKRGHSYPTEILAKTTTYNNQLSSIGICRDITERVTMEQKVRENERMAYIGQIATSLSHEIRNPLSSVQMNLQILKKNPQIKGNDQRRIDISVREVKRLENTLKELLDFAKPLQFQFRRESLNRIIQSSVELLEMKFKEQNITVSAAFDPLLPSVHADRKKLGQAIINLLLNALEASPKGRHIRVSTHFLYKNDHLVQTVIADDGCGLPADHLNDIFKPFFTTKNKGTGLGLSNVWRIAEAHQGWVEAENGNPRGAVFKLYLPAYRN